MGINEQRLVDLETKFSYQDTLIEELRQTVHEQYLTIEKLEKNVKVLMNRLEGFDENNIRAGHEKPPHY
jgi:SlyX protein